MNRRQLLKVGAASMIVVAGGVGLYGATRTPTTALTPWNDDVHNFDDPRVRALSYAILSPNPHNRQPWVATLVGEQDILLTCDLNRRLPATDPFDRQITIGLGCFIETLVMAAASNGFNAEVLYFPDGEPGQRLDGRPLAHIRFVLDSAIQGNELFPFVKQRRSNKEPYDVTKPLQPHAFLEVIAGQHDGLVIDGTLDQQRIEAFRDLSWRAYQVESFTPRTLQESIDLMRIGKAEIEANPDGIDLGGFPLDLLADVGMLNREQLADPASTVFKQGLDMYKKLLFSAMGYVWVTTPNNSRVSQLEAGRAWMRLNLRATKEGVAVHPLSQALQEYAEMAQIYDELHEKLEVAAPSRVQMFGRIGYGPEVGVSPRWPVETRVRRL